MVLWEALDALSHQLELCGIGADTTLVVVVGDETTDDQAALVRAAVARSNADAVELRQVSGRRDGDQRELLPAIVAHADVLLTMGMHCLAPESTAGLRHLHLTGVPPDSFAPHANLRRRVQILQRNLSTSATLVLTDRHGSELRFELDGGQIHADHGLLSDANDRATFPAGWVAVQPSAHRVNGELVLMPGDANLQAGQLISSPLRLEIVDDHISVIDGYSPDADVLRALLEYRMHQVALDTGADGHATYGVAEICLGMNPGQQPSGPFDNRLLDPVLSRLLAGVVTLSFGENLLADRPGPDPVTLALPGRTLAADDLPIVTAGLLEGDLAPDVYEL